MFTVKQQEFIATLNLIHPDLGKWAEEHFKQGQSVEDARTWIVRTMQRVGH